MATKEIKRVSATESAIAEAKASSFTMGSFTLPKNTQLVLGEWGYTDHLIDSKVTGKATPVISLYYPNEWDNKEKKAKEGASPILFYVKSALKQRRDFEGNIIALEGSFNDWLIAQSGKTIGEVENAYNAQHLSKTVVTTITYYHKIARNGDVVEVSTNGYNFVEQSFMLFARFGL